MTTIQSKILKTGNVKWRELKFIQTGDLKHHTKEDKHILKTSLKENGFILPFNVWKAPDGTLWCLDGFHRQHDMLELEQEGVVIPDTLNATFIDCKDIQEAAKFVLLFSSQYASITRAGIAEFMTTYNLSLEVIKSQAVLPILSDSLPVVAADSNPILDETQWYLNVHCANEKECQKLYEELAARDLDVKIVN